MMATLRRLLPGQANLAMLRLAQPNNEDRQTGLASTDVDGGARARDAMA